MGSRTPIPVPSFSRRLQTLSRMGQVTIHEAKTHLSRLIEEAPQGEEIIIAKGRNPLVRIVTLSRKKPPRKAGGARGVLKKMADDFDAHLPDFDEYTR